MGALFTFCGSVWHTHTYTLFWLQIFTNIVQDPANFDFPLRDITFRSVLEQVYDIFSCTKALKIRLVARAKFFATAGR